MANRMGTDEFDFSKDGVKEGFEIDQSESEQLGLFMIICPRCGEATTVNTKIDKGCAVFGGKVVLMCSGCGFTTSDEIQSNE